MKIIGKRANFHPQRCLGALGLHQGDDLEFEIEDNAPRLTTVKTIKILRDQV